MTSPLVTNVKAGDSRNYGVAKRASLWFNLASDGSDAGWEEFGNLVDLSAVPDISELEHESNRRGARTRDRIEISQVKLDLKFKVDEVAASILMKAFGGQGGKGASTVTLRDSKIVANPGGGNSLASIGTSLATVIVRSTNQEGAVTTYTGGGTDYSVNLTTGVISIIASAALDSIVTVPEIHVYWTKSVATEKFTLFNGTPIRGQAQYQVLTESGARIVITLTNVTIKNDGELTFGTGEKWIEMPLSLEALADSSGVLGYFHVIDAAATF